MSYFPLYIDLTNAPVLLVGNGPQIREKRERIASFGAQLRFLETLEEQDLACRPAMVIIGDLDRAEAERCSVLCRREGIPVNVVDIPELCTFFFPALIQRGDLTVGISTGGKSPGFAACLRRRLETVIPERSGEILDWLYQLRPRLKKAHPPAEFRRTLRAATEQSLSLGRPLSDEEREVLTERDVR